MQADAFPYLRNPFDKAVCGLTPLLMAPLRGTLEPPPLGGYRFVAASLGLYAEARSESVEARLLKAEASLPYGDVREGIRLVNGPIPAELLAFALAQSQYSSPDEWAGLIVWNGNSTRYELARPEMVSASGCHVSYRDTLPDGCGLVVDLHSHAGLNAFFSPEDDQSDSNGIYIAGVIGRCGPGESQALIFRMVIHGQFFPVRLVCRNGRFWFVPARDCQSVTAVSVLADAQ